MYRSIGENVATILATSIVILGAIISWFVFLDIVSVDKWFCCNLRLDNIWVIKLPMGCEVDSLVKVMLVVVLSVSSLYICIH